MSRPTYQTQLDAKIWELRDIISDKQTAVCLSLDVPNWQLGRELLQIAAPYICMVKIHPDLFSDWTQSAQTELINMAQEGRYQIMCDQKMADVPKIVYRQIRADMLGLYRVADWITIMPNNYLDVAEYFANRVAENDPTDKMNMRPQLLLVGQMNTKSSLSNTPDFKAAVSEIILQPAYPVKAMITQLNVYSDAVLGMTPGVILDDSVNPDPARYRTIRDAICRDHNQVVILGAGLLGSLTESPSATDLELEAFKAGMELAAKQSCQALNILNNYIL
jgi:orotidine-5'-phosphate decarboxylase